MKFDPIFIFLEEEFVFMLQIMGKKLRN